MQLEKINELKGSIVEGSPNRIDKKNIYKYKYKYKYTKISQNMIEGKAFESINNFIPLFKSVVSGEQYKFVRNISERKMKKKRNDLW